MVSIINNIAGTTICFFVPATHFFAFDISKISRISPRPGEIWGGPGEILRPDSGSEAQNS